MALARSEYRVLRGNPDEQGNRWYYVLVARNGEATSRSTEMYPDRSAAVRGAKDDRRTSRLAKVV